MTYLLGKPDAKKALPVAQAFDADGMGARPTRAPTPTHAPSLPAPLTQQPPAPPLPRAATLRPLARS